MTKCMANNSKSNALMDYNALVLDKLEEKFGLSRYYIKQCINGRRNCVTGDNIRKEYHRLCAQVKEALNQ